MTPGKSHKQMSGASALAVVGAVWQSLERNWFEVRGLAVLGWTVTWAYMLLEVLAGLVRPLGIFDESIPLVSAELINHGHKPIIDFYYIYPPFLDYMYAIVFRILSDTLLVPRLWSSILYIVVAIQASRFLRQRVRSLAPLGPLAALLAAVSLVGVSQLPAWPGYAFALLAIFSYPADEQLDSSATKLRLLVCGLAAGVSLLVRVNFGIYAVAALCGYTCLRVWVSDLPKSRQLFLTVTLVALLICGVTLPNVVFYGWIYGSGTWAALATMVGSMRGALPLRFIVLNPVDGAKLLLFPFFWWVVPVIVDTNRLGTDSLVAVIGGAGVVLIATAERGSTLLPFLIPALTLSIFAALGLWRRRLTSTHLLFVFFYVALLHYYLSRADSAHAEPVWALQGLMFLPLLVPANSEAGGKTGRMKQVGPAFAALLAGICLYRSNPDSIPAPSNARQGAKLVANWIRNPKISDHERIQTALGEGWESIFSFSRGDTKVGEGELDAVKYISSHTRSSDRIFVGAMDNSRIFANDTRLYWLTGRLPGARYYELDAGVASTEAAQERIVLDLQQNGVNWVILQDETGWGEPSFFAQVHAESGRLDDFLSAHFRVAERFGRFSILKSLQ